RPLLSGLRLPSSGFIPHPSSPVTLGHRRSAKHCLVPLGTIIPYPPSLIVSAISTFHFSRALVIIPSHTGNTLRAVAEALLGMAKVKRLGPILRRIRMRRVYTLLLLSLLFGMAWPAPALAEGGEKVEVNVFGG